MGISFHIFVHDNLLPNFTYQYQVAAANSQNNEGPLSDPIQATTIPLHNAVLDILDPGQASIRLYWSIQESSYNGDNYLFDIYQNDNHISTTSSSTFLANNLNPSEEYCFYIIPKINAENSKIH